MNQCLHCDNQIFHRDVASGQLIASLAKRLFNGYTYPEQFTRPVRPHVPPVTQLSPNPLDLPPIPDAPPAISQVQVDQEDGNPQNVAVDDPGQARQAHQAYIQTLCRKR